MAKADRPATGLPAGRLEEGFADGKPLFSGAEAAYEASRCLFCHDAPCIASCPTSIDIPAFIGKIATGNLRGSARTILESNLLGASCARVCPVEVLCEGSCVYEQWERRVIPIGRLQRFAMAKGASVDVLEKRPSSGKKVALVGAGPASLACAGTLALLGHGAVVYERGVHPGGLNTTGVAPYKLAAAESLAEVRFIERLGVTIRTGVEVGKDVVAAALLESHDAVFLGLGLGADSTLGVPGEQGPGVVGAVSWIHDMKLDPTASLAGVRRALVVGGGNTAVDVARELSGLGVESVTMVYRRSASEMRAYGHEMAAARRSGVVLLERAAVAEVIRKGERLTSVRLIETEDGRSTDRERGVEPVDLVVLAIGQAKHRGLAVQFPGVACDDRGRIVVDPETFVTGNPRVFAGGDAVNGGQEVVNAVHDGQAAARAMHALLLGGTDG